MRHRKRGKILSRKTDPRKALIRSLLRSLILSKQIRTTEAKAKALRPMIERLISIGQVDNLAARRRLIALLQDQKLVKTFFEKVIPKYKDRKGGYVKILKIGPRKGDNAPLVIIKLGN